eukprot:gene596-829_t
MAAFDTVIRHGTIATASETYKADVGIKNGRIVAIGEMLTDANEVVDATGLLVLPGGIDSHVHISQPSGPGIVMADGFESGTRSAAAGSQTRSAGLWTPGFNRFLRRVRLPALPDRSEPTPHDQEDRDPVERWTLGDMVLLGDAALPMYPIGSNGASQAILDARVLAFQLAAQPTVAEALIAYEAERRPPTSRLVLANRGEGPERVLNLAEARASDGFAQVTHVISAEELQAVADDYKQIAGFDRAALNARPSLTPPEPEAGRGGVGAAGVSSAPDKLCRVRFR